MLVRVSKVRENQLEDVAHLSFFLTRQMILVESECGILAAFTQYKRN